MQCKKHENLYLRYFAQMRESELCNLPKPKRIFPSDSIFLPSGAKLAGKNPSAEKERKTAMKDTPRTDLACERHRADSDIPGCRYRETDLGICRRHTLRVESERAAKESGCVRGWYETLLFPPVQQADSAALADVESRAADILREMSAALLQTNRFTGCRVLFVGLGNREITADAVGPLAADGIRATAHLRRHRPDLLAALACAEIAVTVPGVMAQSGMESAETVCAVVSRFRPDLVLVADALAARSFGRLAATLQFSDTGVSPGSGIGNRRAALDRTTLGCPVIAMGVPTVTDAATLAHDLLGKEAVTEEKGATEIEKSPLAGTAIPAADAFFVCPREADVIAKTCGALIAGAVNRVFGIPE